ncbi:carbohydrate ABC transporter permease [Jiangella anatolica]|uniref:Carbohydrate ABC transporter permease n=1 Tax=Jiangella anatolica TaxID=2670374 RepID=A0A2W2BI00_9ACTN|nr:carbohydrate ABC transporter permease [Jiangella anatolica]PZF84870.1 carbohydrate ABC transporter permease [Jiangella anatolica]
MGGGVRAGKWFAAVPMAVLALATIYPLVFTVNVAMKTRREYVLDRFALTESLRWDNVDAAWNSVGMARYFVNSVVVVGCSVALLLLLGSMAGFALGQLRFRGSRALFLGCLSALFIPFQVIMVPLARTMADTGLLDTYPGLILAYVAQFLPFTIFLMTSYYAGIPAEIIDAARIDGNTVYGVYRRIMLPIGRPALLSVGILDALFCWNDVLIALLLMPSAEHRTLMVGITALRGQYSDNIPTFAAGVLIAALPVLLLYLFFQRQIADGVTAGSTKG